MSNVKGRFAAYPYDRDHKPVVAVARRGASAHDTATMDAKSEGGEYRVSRSGESMPAETAAAMPAGNQVLDERAKRAARDNRIDELMTVIEGLHGDTLAELAK